MVNAGCISKKPSHNALQDHIRISCARQMFIILKTHSWEKERSPATPASLCVIHCRQLIRLLTQRLTWCTLTFTGRPRHLELVHETPELLSYSHSPQQTLVVEKMFLTPLGALLVLQEKGNCVALIRVGFILCFSATDWATCTYNTNTQTLYLNERLIHIQHGEVVSLSNCKFPVLSGLRGEIAKIGSLLCRHSVSVK